MSMTVRRYSVVLGATAVATLLVATAAATLMMSSTNWMDDNKGLGDIGGWAVLFIVRALFVPVMLFVAVRAGCRAIKIAWRRGEGFPPTANSAIRYFGVMALYIPLGIVLALDLLLLLEAFLYPLPVLLLLVATILTTSKNGRLPGPPVVAPRVAVILVAVAWMVVIGASAAYGRFVLAGDVLGCFAWECPPAQTIGVLGFMVTAATVSGAAVLWSLRRPTGMARPGIIGAVAFACLALLFPSTIALFMPFDAFVPGFFYGIAAIAFLIVAVARKEEDLFQFATA